MTDSPAPKNIKRQLEILHRKALVDGELDCGLWLKIKLELFLHAVALAAPPHVKMP